MLAHSLPVIVPLVIKGLHPVWNILQLAILGAPEGEVAALNNVHAKETWGILVASSVDLFLWLVVSALSDGSQEIG